jgi:hypothetical protein
MLDLLEHSTFKVAIINKHLKATLSQRLNSQKRHLDSIFPDHFATSTLSALINNI